MFRIHTVLIVAGALTLTLLPRTAAAACDVGVPDRTISGFVNANLTVPAGQRYFVTDADVNGNIIVRRSGALIVSESVINGTVEAGNGREVFICIDRNSQIEGSIDVAESDESSTLIIDGTNGQVTVKGAVEMDKTESAACGGQLTIIMALIDSDTQATGACEASVTHNDLQGDFQATDTSVVRFEFNETSSDVAADFGQQLYLRDNPSIGGDLEFTGFASVKILRNSEVNGGITLAENGTATIRDNTFDGGIEVDADPDKVSGTVVKIVRNTLNGNLAIESDQGAVGIARVKDNLVTSGNLTVVGADDVRVVGNEVSNGNLSVEEYVSCVARRNQVPKGNNLGCN